MKQVLYLFGGVLTGCVLTAAPGFSQNVPIAENLWRLVAQEDTDGDQKITVHDRATPFVVYNQTGTVARTLTNTYQMSVLLQELKRADDRHIPETSLDDLQLDESPVDRTHRLIKDF